MPRSFMGFKLNISLWAFFGKLLSEGYLLMRFGGLLFISGGVIIGTLRYSCTRKAPRIKLANS